MRFISLFLALFLALAGGAAHAQTNSCTLVNTGTFQDINVFSDCKRVTNSSGTTVCAVSQVDATQWQSFYNNPPSGVTIGSCPAACAGYSAGSGCFFAGTAGQSCSTVCSSRGGCNQTDTTWVANATNCQNTSNAMGYTTWGGSTSTGRSIGCVTYPSKSTYAYADAGGACANFDNNNLYGRFCGCNNGSTSPINGQCDGSGGCTAGTYQFVSSGFIGCPGIGIGNQIIYNCLGINGGTNATGCADNSDLSACCGAVPC